MRRLRGPLGFWDFSLLNKIFGKKKSIKDHKVVSGEPTYEGDHIIVINEKSKPFKIRVGYGFKLRTENWVRDSMANSNVRKLRRGNMIVVTEEKIRGLSPIYVRFIQE